MLFPFKENCVITVTGPRGSGKSFLTSHLLENKEFTHDFDVIVIMSPSLDVNDDYHTKILERLKERGILYYVVDVTMDKIEDLFDDMYKAKKLALSLKRRRIKDPQRTHCPKMLIVLDDIIDSGVVNFGGSVDKIAERGRHVNMTAIICSQRISAVSRSIRINSDYFFIFPPHNQSEVERFLEEFVSRAHKKAVWAESDNIFNQPHHFIMIDNAAKYGEKLKHGTTQDLLNNSLQQIKILIKDEP